MSIERARASTQLAACPSLRHRRLLARNLLYYQQETQTSMKMIAAGAVGSFFFAAVANSAAGDVFAVAAAAVVAAAVVAVAGARGWLELVTTEDPAVAPARNARVCCAAMLSRAMGFVVAAGEGDTPVAAAAASPRGLAIVDSGFGTALPVNAVVAVCRCEALHSELGSEVEQVPEPIDLVADATCQWLLHAVAMSANLAKVEVELGIVPSSGSEGEEVQRTSSSWNSSVNLPQVIAHVVQLGFLSRYRPVGSWSQNRAVSCC
mmetsp:Transcript_22409/g.43565  ORF Transcript_22409/g.43565 Transcript_22409/m.43565 type:complete len:263 (-) Transcript_22409:827-1615(-)